MHKAKVFDGDPMGAILEFADLFRRPDATHERQAWCQANLKIRGGYSPDVHVWAGWAITRKHLRGLLERGRDVNEVRNRIDRCLLKLEMENLLEPYAEDDDPSTTFRVITPLGKELLHEDSYREYVGGLRAVVERWRTSVAKLYCPSESGIGTGYLVAPDLVATARHIVDNLSRPFVVEFDFDSIVRAEVKEVVRPTQPDIDIALVRLTAPVQHRSPFVLQPAREVLEEVVIFGYPTVPLSDGAYQLVNRGEISATDVSLYGSGRQVLIVSTLLRGGNSGGPVVNRRGQVVGTVSENLFQQLTEGEKSLNEGLGFAAATPSEWMRDLIANKI